MLLITGANGMVGRSLVKQALDADIAVKALVYPGEKLFLSNHLNLEIMEGDINRINWDDVLDGVGSVIHLAAKVHVLNKSEEVWDEFHQTNVEATKNLCRAVINKNIKKFIFVSTVGIYGHYPRLDEAGNLIIAPQNMYARSKLMAEAEVINQFEGKVPYIILRPTMMYGFGDRGNMNRMLNAIRRKRFIIPGSGNNKKNALYVEDFVNIILKVLVVDELANESYIVANNDVLTLREICNTLSAKVAGGWHVPSIPEVIIRVAGRIGDIIPILPLNSATVRKLTIDSDFSPYSTIQKSLGIHNETTLAEALDEMEY